MKKMLALLKEGWKLTVFIILLALAFAYAMFEGGFVSWFLFYSFLPFCLYGLGLTVYSLKDIEVTRQIDQGHFTAGENITVTFTLKRRLPFPLLYIVAEEQMSEQLFVSFKKRKLLLLPGMRREFTVPYRLEDVPRGEHYFTGVRLKTGDLLGLVEKEIVLYTENNMVVYPAIVPISARRPQGQLSQGGRASRKGPSRERLLATGVREYQSGDRFSSIHWKATAKRNEMMTKEYEQQESHDVMIVMDRSPHLQFESIVSFTASLIDSLLQHGEQMSFLSSGVNEVYYPLRGGMQQRTEVLYHLATVKKDSPLPFYQVIETDRLLQQQLTTMLVVGAINEQLLQRLSVFASSRREVVVFLIKGSGALFTDADRAYVEMARLQHIQIKVFRENEHGDAFLEVHA